MFITWLSSAKSKQTFRYFVITSFSSVFCVFFVIMENERRERKANFSDNEVKQLLEGVGEEKDLIQSKLQSSVTVRKKKEASRSS